MTNFSTRFLTLVCSGQLVEVKLLGVLLVASLGSNACVLFVVRAWRFEHGLRERQDERERLAREIHDTFLQAVQGLVLHVHVATQALPVCSARDSLESALSLGERTLAEGRTQVYRLRDSAWMRADLLKGYLLAATDEIMGTSPSVYSAVVGVARRLSPDVQDELHAVGREAIRNALQHASAESIDIRLTYSWRGLSVDIVDDGVGIDPSVLAQGGRPGHWGLPGMNERMAGVGGTLELVSVLGQGTQVRLHVPARTAYLSRFAVDWGVVMSSWR